MDRETAVCFQGAKWKAKQLRHSATRSWVCNNDKRIVPWGGKHLHTGDGERGFLFFFFWLMSIKYTVHSDKQEETTRYTVRKLKQRQPERKNRAMKYSCDIFTDKLLELAALFGDFGERELALDWQPLGAETHAQALHTQKHTQTTHTLVKL